MNANYITHTQTHTDPQTIVLISWTVDGAIPVCVSREAEGRAYPAAHRVGAAANPASHAADRGPPERAPHSHPDDGAAAGSASSVGDGGRGTEVSDSRP